MKKHLLFTTSIFVSGLLCAQVANRATKIPSHLANIAVKRSAVDADRMYTGVPFQAKAQVALNKTAAMPPSETILGSSYYDLQSNASVGDRIVVNADGTMAACWTFEPTDVSGSYANRGTGYNYYNGSTWGAPPTVRVENARVGWGNIVNTRSGAELILSHNGGASKAHIASRATKGSGAWANSTSAFPSVAGGNWWPRMITSSPSGGDTIYALTITYPVANGGAVYNGLDGALLFSRSVDAGLSWDIQNQIPTGFTSANFLGFGGDGYAIAARGATVAIVAGNSDSDIALSKSTDGGVTWTATTVQQFPLPLWDATTTTSDINNDAVADTIESNDASYAIALDPSGKAYVAYGGFRILNDAPSAAGWSYFPYTDGLYMWDESMPANAGGYLVAAIEDLGEQGTIYFPTPSVSTDLAFGRWQKSLTSYPSMAFNATGDLYLSYSAIVDSLISATNPEKVLRHQYLTRSVILNPNMPYWCPPHDLVPSMPGSDNEGVFGSMAKYINGDVHILYQRDFFPGNGIPATSGTNPDGDNLGNTNEFVYVKVPESDFAGCVSGVKEEFKNTSLSNISFYPNPATTIATLDIKLTETAKVDVAILNTVGQTIYSTSVSGNVGANKVELNLSNLSSGLYFYQVKVGNSKAITQKFAVSK